MIKFEQLSEYGCGGIRWMARVSKGGELRRAYVALEARDAARRKMMDDDFDERWPGLKRQKAEGGAR